MNRFFCIFLTVLFWASAAAFSQQPIKTFHFANTIYWADLSSDGKRIAIAGKDSTVRVYELQGHELIKVTAHQSSVSAAKWLPISHRILSSSYDQRAILSTIEGQTEQVFAGHDSGVINIAISADESRICTVSRDRTARLWTLDGELISTLADHTAQVNYAIFLSGNQGLLTASYDGTIKHWDLNGQPKRTYRPAESGIRVLTLSPDERNVMAGHRDGTVSVTVLETAQSRYFKAHDQMVSSLCLVENGLFISSSMDKMIKVWNREFELVQSRQAHDSDISSIDLVSDLLVSCSGDNTVKLWDLSKVLDKH